MSTEPVRHEDFEHGEAAKAAATPIKINGICSLEEFVDNYITEHQVDLAKRILLESPIVGCDSRQVAERAFQVAVAFCELAGRAEAYRLGLKPAGAR